MFPMGTNLIKGSLGLVPFTFRSRNTFMRPFVQMPRGFLPPNDEWRRRYGERVFAGIVESTVNTVVGKRFCKRQQVRWSNLGARLML